MQKNAIQIYSGSHMFMNCDLENYVNLIEWRGGQVDVFGIYTERCGDYTVNCNLSKDDQSSYFNTYGGEFNGTASSAGLVIRANTHDFNSFGTKWTNPISGGNSIEVYALPREKINFYGFKPNESTSKVKGASGWEQYLNFM